MSDLLVETIPTLSFDKQYMNNSKIGRIISTKPIEIVEECSELTIPVHGEIINIVDICAVRITQAGQVALVGLPQLAKLLVIARCRRSARILVSFK